MAYNKWHNLNNLDKCVQNMSLNVGTGKLNVKNSSEIWDGMRGKSLRTFYAVVVFCCCCCCCCFLFCFMFSFFDFYFVEFLAAFNYWYELWKEVVLRIFIFKNQQLVSRQNFLRNTSGGFILVRFKAPIW